MIYISKAKKHAHLWGIQQLRGQEEGEGFSQKPTLVHSGEWGGGGSQLNVHVDQNLAILESMSYYGLVDARISASEKDLPVSVHVL